MFDVFDRFRFQSSVPLDPALSEEERLNWLRLIRCGNIGCISFYKLLQRHGSAAKALDWLETRAQKSSNIVICSEKEALDEYKRLQKMGAQLLTPMDAAYPLPLSATEDAPPVLTVMGDLSLLSRPIMGVVGSRSASVNGRRFAWQLAQDLGQAGWVSVSGLARGIDTAVHQGSLKTGTIAVIAGGIDTVYPPENADLQNILRKDGLVISENPFGQQPFARAFPKRNRIVAGMSAGLVVVEASMKSGSLITARMAAEYGRDVFAVPGHPMDPKAQGTNQLIKDGAIMLRDVSDILESMKNNMIYPESSISKDPPVLCDSSEFALEYIYDHDPQHSIEIILSHLNHTPLDLDDLVRDTNIPPHFLQDSLIELELEGKIQRHHGGGVSLLIDV